MNKGFVECEERLLNVKAANINPAVIDQLKVLRPCIRLGDALSIVNTAKAMWYMANWNAVGTEEFPAGLLEVNLNGNGDIPDLFHGIVAAVWKRGRSATM